MTRYQEHEKAVGQMIGGLLQEKLAVVLNAFGEALTFVLLLFYAVGWFIFKPFRAWKRRAKQSRLSAAQRLGLAAEAKLA